MAEKFTTEIVEDLRVQGVPQKGKTRSGEDITLTDKIEKGKSLLLRVSYGGRMTWKILYYVIKPDADGNLRTVARAKKLGRYPKMKVKEAYAAARRFNHQQASAAASAGTFENVAREWLQVKVVERGLRSAGEITRHLETYVLPRWGTKNIFDIDLDHVNALLDLIKYKKIERPTSRTTKGPHAKDGKARKRGKLLGGPSQADAVLATIGAIMKWYRSKNKDYISPIYGVDMKRDLRSSNEKARERVLSDDEIRALWTACGDLGNQGALVRLLLLTGQRLRKVANMQWADIANGIWTIRSEKREKGNAGEIRLPRIALDLIEPQPVIADNPHIFPGSRGAGPINSFAQLKRDVDRLMPKDMPRWVFHDLRRTARTRMADLDVEDRVAEITLGHQIKGIEKVYNRAKRFERKSEALAVLAAHIAAVLNPTPQGTNVVQLRQEPTPVATPRAS